MLTRRTFAIHAESWGFSKKGDARQENQDAFLNWPDHMLWAVADGVGSSEYGGLASRSVIQALLGTPFPMSLDHHIVHVKDAIMYTNGMCLAKAGKTGKMAASTVVALLVQGGWAACLWAGDSRCYLFRDGVLYQCTKDHTVRQEKIDSGELTAPEAHRMIRGNLVTNAIGVHTAPRLEQVRFSLRSGDRFLLCSDGLFAVTAPEALLACLTQRTAKAAAERISETMMGMRQPDDITVVTVFLSQLT
ncbi:serine/threonine-protein phosphatase [Desulfosarcina sp. OttesenSCG-928-G10]|nr:serine/threonine-protein phosphatase [Desulfosarcina sp. OttesenSCG-928-G10]